MNTLPQPTQCCATCDDPVVQNIPGPTGPAGSNGTNGTDGINAYTVLTVAFTMPAELASAPATVGSTVWMAVGQILYVQTLGFLQITAISTATSVTLKNLEDTASSAYAINAAPGSIAGINSKVCAAGVQGPIGALAGLAAGGDLKGTYPNPKLALPNTLGSIPVGNGTDAVSLAAGADGFVLAEDVVAFATTKIGWKHSLPIVGDPNIGDNRLARLDGTTGKPVPIQSSKMELTDNGALQSTPSGGDPRGTDAVDLQVNRTGATMAATGIYSAISGGRNNTAFGAASVVGGGDTNAATSIAATVAGGTSNTASAQNSSVAGGSGNSATTKGSAIGGGEGNTISGGNRGTIGGGQSNAVSAQEATIGGGNANQATDTQATVGGGDSNVASAVESTVAGGGGNQATGGNSAVGGGQSNEATGTYSCIPGGLQAKMDKYGQMGHASGRFATNGDAQFSRVILRRSTTDATANVEAFLNGDGATDRVTVPLSKSMGFQGVIMARTSAGVSGMWTFVGAVENNAGATAASGITVTNIYDSITVAGAPAVAADNVNDAIKFSVTGKAATLIRWVISVQLTEVQY